MAATAPPMLRPLGLGDLLDETFALYRRGFRTFLGISAIVQVPIAIVSMPLAATYAGYFERIGGGADGLRALSVFDGPMLVLLALAVLFSVIGWMLQIGAVCRATSAYYLGQSIGVEGAYRHALRRFWPLFRQLVLFGCLALGLMLLAVAPAVVPALICISFPAVTVAASYLLVSWSLAPSALVLEDSLSATRSLGRSRALVHRAWWRTGWALMLLLTLLGVLQLSASTLVQIVGIGLQAMIVSDFSAQPGWIAAIISLLSNLVSVLTSSLLYIGLTVLYYDRRIRAEGFDLVVRARALAGTTSPADPA